MPKINEIVRRRVMELEEEIKHLKKRVRFLEETSHFEVKPILIDLSDHLRKTYEILQSGPKTAEEISLITKRARAVESMYANQLVTMKLAKKYKVGRKTVFQVEEIKQ